MNSTPISVTIVTYNCQEYLDQCLSSVGWANERVIFDLGSTDDTLAIAQKHNCRIIIHDWVPIVEMVREEAINECLGEWILVLDPDEQVPASLAQRLQQIASEDVVDAVSIPWQTYIFGRWIKHSGWNDDRHIRFFRKGAVDWPRKVHAQVQARGRVLELPAEEGNYVIHLSYENVSQFIEKMNRYTTLEADKRAQWDESIPISKLASTALSEFRKPFLLMEGFKDGYQGLAVSELMSFYYVTTYLKLAEKRGWTDSIAENPRQLLSESRKGLLVGVWTLFQGMEYSAESRFLRLLYGLARRMVAVMLRLRAY